MDMDAQLIWDNDEGCGDIAFVNGDIKRGKPIESSVYISLFCDAKATDFNDAPYDPDSRRGWWGDLLKAAGSAIGSNIWQLEREKMTQGTLNIVKSYCELALEWMLTDGIADRIEIETENTSDTKTPTVFLSIKIYRGSDTIANIQYKDLWNAQIDDGEE